MGAEGDMRYGAWTNVWGSHAGIDNFLHTSPSISKKNSQIVHSTSSLRLDEIRDKLIEIKKLCEFILQNANSDPIYQNTARNTSCTARAIPASRKVVNDPVFQKNLETITDEEIVPLSKTLEEISTKISKIQSLTIMQKDLIELPSSIKYCTGLRELKLGINKLTTLPDLIELKLLKQLDISFNPIEELPTCLVDMADQFVKQGINIEATKIKKAPQKLRDKLDPCNFITDFTP